METIIGLLVILLPVIFKLIGKRLEQSGHTAAAGKMRDISEIFGETEGEDDQMHDGGTEVEFPVFEKPVYEEPSPEKYTVSENVTRQVQFRQPEVRKPEVRKVEVRKAPILIEEEEKKKAEKIDPKKLVIYSEIMKPKYAEE